MKKILVTYASVSGATAEVAEFIAEVLCEKGAVDVDVLPMGDVAGEPAGYTAVILASPIQGQAWLPEATQFIQNHQEQLKNIPTAMFSLCMTLAMRNGEQYRPQITAWTASLRALVQPVSEAHFAGVLDIAKIPSFSDRLKFRLSVLFRVWSEGDHRDWTVIRDWAEQLTTQLAQNGEGC
jgi:menaquinone-dependent protoporphyrinogen oxidase